MTGGGPTAEDAARRYLDRYEIAGLLVNALLIRGRVPTPDNDHDATLLLGTDQRLHRSLAFAFTDDDTDAYMRAQILVGGLQDYLSRLEERGLLKETA